MKLHFVVGILVALGVVGIVRRAAPQPSRCESIVNSDERHYCRAVTGRRPIYCESIRDSDLRQFCRAVTQDKHIYCESIRDKDLRYLCRAQVGAK